MLVLKIKRQDQVLNIISYLRIIVSHLILALAGRQRFSIIESLRTPSVVKGLVSVVYNSTHFTVAPQIEPLITNQISSRHHTGLELVKVDQTFCTQAGTSWNI